MVRLVSREQPEQPIGGIRPDPRKARIASGLRNRLAESQSRLDQLKRTKARCARLKERYQSAANEVEHTQTSAMMVLRAQEVDKKLAAQVMGLSDTWSDSGGERTSYPAAASKALQTSFVEVYSAERERVNAEVDKLSSQLAAMRAEERERLVELEDVRAELWQAEKRHAAATTELALERDRLDEARAALGPGRAEVWEGLAPLMARIGELEKQLGRSDEWRLTFTSQGAQDVKRALREAQQSQPSNASDEQLQPTDLDGSKEEQPLDMWL